MSCFLVMFVGLLLKWSSTTSPASRRSMTIVVSCSLVMLVVSSGEVNLLTPISIAHPLVSLVVVSLVVEVFL